jgi:hypothetical protein
VGTIDTRATTQIWSSSSRQANGLRNSAAPASPARTTKSPIAKAGLDQAIPLKVDDLANAEAALHYLLQTEAVGRDGCGVGTGCGSTAMAGGFPD